VGERIVECVPNVSEGRDRRAVDAIAGAVRETDGAWLLDTHVDPDHNRSVLTFAGEPEAVVQAAVRLAGHAVELIDLSRQRGVHPRLGALDVLPFVPLRGISMEECAELAVRAGEEIWRGHRIPVYLYEHAARRPGRRNLADVRRPQFEGLRDAAPADASSRPDIGGPGLHPTAGAIAVAARKILIAFNIQLETGDISVARRIARRIRASSGGLPAVKAMGVLLASRNLAQVSMNLTDFEMTPPHVAFEEVSREAEREGTSVLASELVGLIPEKAVRMAGGRNLLWENLTPASILENRLAEAVDQGRDTI